MKRQEKEEILNKIKELQEQVDNATIENENPFDVKDGGCQVWCNEVKYKAIDVGVWWSSEVDEYVLCKDKSIVEARQKRHHLADLLEKFAYENDAAVTKEIWEDESTSKYGICYSNYNRRHFITSGNSCENLGETYFITREVAQRAIDEIVIPFMRNIND